MCLIFCEVGIFSVQEVGIIIDLEIVGDLLDGFDFQVGNFGFIDIEVCEFQFGDGCVDLQVFILVEEGGGIDVQ